ncbi:MAG: RHS repeat protein [Rhodanobacter sp.]
MVLPDGTDWQYTYTGTLKPPMPLPEESLLNCRLPPSIINVEYTLAAKGPSGATANYRFKNTRHGRSGVNVNECVNSGTTENPVNSLRVGNFFDVMSLTQKTISGPGLPTATWSYDYGEHSIGEDMWGHPHQPYQYPCTTCALDKTVVVSEPDESQRRYRFGFEYAFNDGRLLQTDILRSDGSVIRTQTNDYLAESAVSTQSFYSQYGDLLGGIGDPATAHVRPTVHSETTQDGVTFTNIVTGFDSYARATQQTESSSLGYSRATQTTYHDNTGKWVLGQVAERKVDGITASATTFDTATALPLTHSAFGVLKQTLTWNGDGTIATVKDGDDNITAASSWKRGIPQVINYPDGYSESAGVNDAGWITWVKDQNGHTTNYGYDPMGRLASITYPTGDEVAWNQTLLSFVPVGGSEYGIPGGHWKQTVHTGNGYEVTYFDAMWRPLVTERYDSANKAATLSQVVQRYDTTGRKVFASYPINNLASYATVNAGSHTSYDALDRVTAVQQDSELGTLTTTTDYLSGFKTRVTDPKSHATTTAFMAFDRPTTDWPVRVDAPAGITQTIARDVFGSPTSITQSGLYGAENNTLTKTLTYDSHHRLCRTTEPESGSEVMDWDGADNLLWSAAGLAISGTGCGQEQVAATARTMRTYDAMNRVKTILPPAGTQSTSYDYDPAGRVTSAVASGISTWNGNYNFRGMLTGESQQLVGQSTWAIGYAHDANGHVSFVHYPDGESVSYTPDALGRPTRVGNYATGIGYFPNGEPSQFAYGNGAVYLAEQNARQLLGNFTYGVGSTLNLSEDLAYDANGNITTVVDLAGGPRNKSFGYDALNRLTSATANGLWGTQAFTYDALNNLRTLQTSGQTSVYHYDTSNKLTSISGAATVNYAYDTRGNVTTKNSTTLLFDQKNQLTKIVGVNSYAYDAAGRRVSKTPAAGSPTYYFYNQAGQLMHQFEPGSARATNFIYLGRKLLAKNATVSLVAPSAVSFDANPNNGSYTVSWGTVPGATSYLLQESANGGAWTTVYSGSAASKALSGKVGGSYVYRVEGCIGATCGGWTSSATLGVRPALPTITVPTGTINGTYTVSWTAPASATGYDVQERVNGGAWNTIASNTAAITISRPGTSSGSYAYQVSAKNAYGSRGWAASGAVTVDTTYGVLPKVPASLTVPTSSSTGSATLSWSASSLTTSYTLQQSSNGGANWSTVYTGSGTSTVVSGLANGSYIFQVQACNTYGCSAWKAGSATLIVTYPPATAPPLSAPASSASGSYTVSWGAVSTATSYILQEQVNGGAWATIQTGSATSKAISGKGNATYGYKVQACNVGGCGPWSSAGTTTVLLPPAVPASVTAPTTSSGSIAVSWAASATATSYTLQQRLGTGSWSSVYSGAATSSTRTVTASGSYTYQVRACNASGCSAYKASGAVTVTIPPASAPSLSVPATSNSGSYTVSWSAVSSATSYTLQEQVNGGGWGTVQSSSATSKAFSSKGNASYGYRAQACNAGGCGAWSAGGTIVVTLPPAAPATVTAPFSVLGKPYNITWSASATATSYKVQRTNLDDGSTAIVATTAATSATMPTPITSQFLHYAVQACNAGGCSAFKNASNPTQANPPGPIE